MEIKVDDVSYQYKKKNYVAKNIFENITINFKKGKINCIIGSTGSGKTTLIELLSGNLNPNSGNIIINSDKSKKIGFVSQTFEYQFICKTVYEELKSTLLLNNYKLRQVQKRINDVLLMVNLKDIEINRKITTLSFSEKKRLLLAIALIHNPDILILDDPTNGLDVKNKNSLIKLIRILKNRYEKTIIIVSNDINFVHIISDHIFVLNNKKIFLEGKKYDIFSNTKKLKQCQIDIPDVIKFSNTVLEKKKIKMGYRDEINDLIKDIYRFVK